MYRGHPRLFAGVVCLILIILGNVYFALSGDREQPLRRVPGVATQQDRDFLLALYQLTQTDLSNPDKVAATMKTSFTVTHSQGQDSDRECEDGKRQVDIDTYTPTDEFWKRWEVSKPEDELFAATSGHSDKTGEGQKPRFVYVVTRPHTCSSPYASLPAPWGIARFITAPAFGCADEAILKRGFPKLAKDSWTHPNGIVTYRAIDSLNDGDGTMLIAASSGAGTCLDTISVAGGHMWGRTYREAEARYLQCEAALKTQLPPQASMQGQDFSDAVHRTCGGEPYFPEIGQP